MDLRELGFYLRGRLNSGLAAVLNAGRPVTVVPLRLETILALSQPTPLDYVRLLEGRSNHDRQEVLDRLLT
ncbi:MAG: hypothetical protein HY682_00105, partial [Chloroflexi bacterium]|nr:hypothetical protein [Chloroflexota bacterium]